jgi:hypothetical protein
LYAYCVGIPSSRRIERACWEDAAFRVLTGNQQPDHSRISDFRLVHLDALAGLVVQVLRLCQKAGLVSPGNVALDGTKVKANASKHMAMSHERMLKVEAQLEDEIAALLRKAELIDAQEDARYGKGKRGDELPNCRAAVDGDHQIIVAVGVSNRAADQHHFVPMMERIVANTGQLPEKLIADAGYCSTSNIEASEQRGLDAYLSTSRQEHGTRPRPSRGPAPRDLDARGRMDRKLRSKAGQAIYALRKIIAEPVFGQIKGARGLDRFLLRGLEKVDGEWTLMAITHNIGKLHRASLAAS